MATYIVDWSDEIYNVTTPKEAAKLACANIAHGESLYFTVTNASTGEQYGVDLAEEDNNIIEFKNY